MKSALDVDVPVYKVNQVHGARVCSTSSLSPVDWDAPGQEEADALIAEDKGCVGVVTADCVPLLIGCTQTGLVAAVHAGWRGLKSGVVRNTIKAMQRLGSTPLSMVAAIGPCICLNCYEVSSDVANCFPESSDPVKGKPDNYLLDLALATEVSLIGAGLSSTGIDKLEECTCCSGKSLFSYRKSGGDCGRQYSFICR